jgi:hypothetical protein
VSISGFMVVRDVESQGYPFIEAAAAALAACDELVISDGCSTDRTWDGLAALHSTFGERVRLYRDPWPGPENHGAILSEATNVARRRCRGSWCLSVQANEVLPERSARALRDTARSEPQADIVALPYLLLIGPHLATGVSIRRRLFRNLPDIVAVGDACNVGGVLEARPIAVAQRALPEPIYRYRAMFPEGYLAKLRSVRPRTRPWAKELAHAEAALKVSVGAPDPGAAFWGLVRDYLADEAWIDASSGAPRTQFIYCGEPPPAARHLVGRWRYDLDDSIAWLAGQPARAVA